MRCMFRWKEDLTATREDISDLEEEGGGPFPVPWDLISPQHTPALRTMTFRRFNDTFWPHLDNVFSEPSRPLEIKFMVQGPDDRSGDPVYTGYGDEGPDIELPDVYDLFKNNPTLHVTGLLLPEPEGRGLILSLESLRGCNLQRLGIDLGGHWLRFRDDSSTLPAICSVVQSMENLQALYMDYRCQYAEEQEAKDLVISIALDIAKANSGLEYIRFGRLAWRIRRFAATIKVELLNEMEDIEACPELFRIRKFDAVKHSTVPTRHRLSWDIFL